MTDTERIPDPGFYGKLPSYGDFIQKRLPRDFIAPWDEWLQAGIATAKEKLPRQWLTFYLNCPAWKFVLGAGVCGAQPCAGVTIPSVDKVGRYFNFTLATMLPLYTVPAHFLIRHFDWLERLEALALTVLEEELDQDGIETAIGEFSTLPVSGEPIRPVFDSGEDYLRLTFYEPTEARHQVQALLHELIRDRRGENYGIWMQQGSTQVNAQILCCAGMPGIPLFLDLLMSGDAVEPAPGAEPAADDILEQFLSE